MGPTVEVRVEGHVAGLEGSHPAVLGALDELFADLKSVPELKTAERDVAGRAGKGVLAGLIVVLSSTGSITAFARIVRLWLERDRHRLLTVSITELETGRVIKIEGEQISIGTLTDALGVVDGRPGEEPGEPAGADG
jgi:Effector Associated Constant Component 1